jgi:F0F1-type ATP synthase delta subunit
VGITKRLAKKSITDNVNNKKSDEFLLNFLRETIITNKLNIVPNIAIDVMKI